MAAEAAAASSAPFPHHANGRAEPGAAGARLQELYERHARMARGLCRLLLRDAGEAEDATQQTFLSAYRALLGGVLPREPAAWIATIARNECRSRIRMRMRTPLVGSVEADDIPDPVDAAVRRFDMHALWAAIGDLPPRQREAFLLRELGGLSYEELALALGVTVPAVESLLQRARVRLRAALEPARTAVPALGRLLPWPVAVKLAASTVGASLIVGGTFAASREDGGPAKSDPAPAVARAAAAPIRPARLAAHTAPLVFQLPVHAVSATTTVERRDVTERRDPSESRAVTEPQDVAAAQGDGGDGQDAGDGPSTGD
ncbi:MAG: RNA polymerase sigma factor [Gaiellaceae bacterium]